MSPASSVIDTYDILQYSNSGDFFQLQASHLSLEDPTSAPGATRQYISVSRLVLFIMFMCTTLTPKCECDHLLIPSDIY